MHVYRVTVAENDLKRVQQWQKRGCDTSRPVSEAWCDRLPVAPSLVQQATYRTKAWCDRHLSHQSLVRQAPKMVVLSGNVYQMLKDHDQPLQTHQSLKHTNSSTIRSFETSFTFSITPYNGQRPGHGLVFIFVPSAGIQGSRSLGWGQALSGRSLLLPSDGRRRWEVLRFGRDEKKRDCWGRKGYFGLKGFFMANVDRSLFGWLRWKTHKFL